MSDIEFYEQSIYEMLARIKKSIDLLAKKEFSQRKGLLTKYENEMKLINNQIDAYNLEVADVKDPREQLKHYNIIDNLRNEHSALKKKIENASNEILYSPPPKKQEITEPISNKNAGTKLYQKHFFLNYYRAEFRTFFKN